MFPKFVSVTSVSCWMSRTYASAGAAIAQVVGY